MVFSSLARADRAVPVLRAGGFVCLLALALVMSAATAACGPQPRSAGDYDVISGGGSADAGPSGLRQRDGELAWEEGHVDPSVPAPRGAMNADIKQFLLDNVFWTGNDTIRVEAAGKYVWFNPVGVPDAERYGADVILVTDSFDRHFSMRDIEMLNDGYSRLLLPDAAFGRQVISMPYVALNRYQRLPIADMRVMSFPAFSNYPRNESWRNHLGYHVDFGPVSVAYFGPMTAFGDVDDEGNKLEIPAAEIVIASLASPATDGEGEPAPIASIVAAASRAKALALVIIGADSLGRDAWTAAIRDLDETSHIPVWLPRLPFSVSQ